MELELDLDLDLVSIICLCYNQRSYIKEALDSVINQTYPLIEIIIIDDASTDGSAELIQEYIKPYPDISFTSLKENVGNCTAFNIGLKKAKGVYITDFAMDDVFLADRVKRQIDVFKSLDAKYGVVFSDVSFIDAQSNHLGTQYNRDKLGRLIEDVPQGNIYKDLLERYFISPASMMVRREVFASLNGYDEKLAYEDFDFWVRSSRKYHYFFIDEILTLKRVLKNSHGSKFTQRKEYNMQHSTLIVCEKALLLNKSEQENGALVKRIRYHMRQSLFTENFTLVKDYYKLLLRIKKPTLLDLLIRFAATLKIPLFFIFRLFR